MIRSRLPFVRIILVPYLALLFLFVLVTGTGSAWLYYKSRQAQSQLLIHGLLSSVTPLVEQLVNSDTTGLIGDQKSWLHRDLEDIFNRIPNLEDVSVRSDRGGFRKYHDRNRALVTEAVPPSVSRPSGDRRSTTAAVRLYSETAPLLRVEYHIQGRNKRPVLLEFGFNRAALRDSVNQAMATLLQAITFFLAISLTGLLAAFAMTVWAAGRARQLEAHMQELYRHASAAELMAGLVHDLRNPLASFRANLASLRITPEESDEIITEMDHDLVRLDAKLSSMLDLTRQRNEPVREVNGCKLLEDVSRLAEPLLTRQNLRLCLHCRLNRPIVVMADAMRDALLNLVINSAESGQLEGEIELEAWQEKGKVLFAVHDRGDGLPDKTDIFAPFVTTKETGHGLGLAISRRTVEAHGGTILAGNRDGGGTTFTIILPQPPSRGTV
ncbi:ATP-binding protein [Desulfolithobacter sp.]